jgi:hypothetical protein
MVSTIQYWRITCFGRALRFCGIADVFALSGSSIADATLDTSSLTWLADDAVRYQQVDGFVYAEVTDTTETCVEVLGDDYSDCKVYESGNTTYYYWYPDDDTVQYLYESYADIVSPIEGITNQHFMVWMRAAGLPDFRKLYGVFDIDATAGDYITLDLTTNFEVVSFDGSKSIILSTLNDLGSQNYYLAYCFFLVAVVQLLAGFSLTWKRLMNPRRLGDIRVLTVD